MHASLLPGQRNIWKFKPLNSWEMSLKSIIYYSHNESHTVNLGGKGEQLGSCQFLAWEGDVGPEPQELPEQMEGGCR